MRLASLRPSASISGDPVNPFRRLTALCAVVIAASVLPLSPAGAESIAYVDARQDAREVIFDEGDPGTRPRTRISDLQRNLDLARVRYSHGRREVTAVLRFTDLTRTARLNVHGAVTTATSGAMGYTAVLTWSPKRATSRLALLGPDEFRPIRCGARHHIDFAADTVELRFPRGCFDDAAWVRVAFVPNVFAPGETRDEIRFLFDHAFLNRLRNRPGLSPRLYAGPSTDASS